MLINAQPKSDYHFSLANKASTTLVQHYKKFIARDAPISAAVIIHTALHRPYFSVETVWESIDHAPDRRRAIPNPIQCKNFFICFFAKSASYNRPPIKIIIGHTRLKSLRCKRAREKIRIQSAKREVRKKHVRRCKILSDHQYQSSHCGVAAVNHCQFFHTSIHYRIFFFLANWQIFRMNATTKKCENFAQWNAIWFPHS